MYQIGEKIHNWVVVSDPIMKKEGIKNPRIRKHYKVRCFCGTIRIKTPFDIKRHKSCNRCALETSNKPNKKHGYFGTKTYNVWATMKQRCSNDKYADFHNYGGRGIKVCDRWKNSFEAFVADMGERPKGMTLDRIDNDGNYEPSNCRWVDRKTQARNRRNGFFVEHQGRKILLIELLKNNYKKYFRVYRKIKNGMPSEKALINELDAEV